MVKKTVAIWSSLKFTNYGDDLQALAYAKHIRSLGYNVRIFQLDKGLAKMNGFESVDTIDELCNGVKLCIIAGGGLLSPFNFLRRTLNRNYAECELMFKELYRATVEYGTKFCAISMGGDGKARSPKPYYGKWRNKLFSSPNFLDGTVRLAGDVEQMKKFGKDFMHYPDMLFKSPDFFEAKMLPPTNKIRVGLNFKKNHNYKYLDRQFLADLLEYTATHDDIEFHFTTTHMKYVGLDYQYVPDKESENIKIDLYETPEQLLGVLSSCDVFVTSMLHLGLTGLANGKTPFLSYRGPGKAKSFLRSIKGDWAILDDNITFKELRDKYLTQSKEMMYEKYDDDAIQKMKELSGMHYKFCEKIVEEFA